MAYVLDDNLPDFKPCPFCGREPALQKDKRYPKWMRSEFLPIDGYTVVCNTKECPIYHADNTWYFSAIEAVQAWNRRIESNEKTAGDNKIPLKW